MAKLYPPDPLAIDAGELRHTVQIQQQAMTPDPTTGAPSQGWSTVLTTQANISTASSREVWQAAQFSAQVSHVIKMRWPGDAVTLAGGMQVLFGSRTFKLQTVENVMERNRVVLLHCLEINGAVS